MSDTPPEPRMSEPIDDIESAIERASGYLHNSQQWEAEGVYAEFIAPALDRARTALTLANQRAEAAEAERDATFKSVDENWITHQQMIAMRAERDALRKDAARYRDAIDTFLSAQGTTREWGAYDGLNAALAVQPRECTHVWVDARNTIVLSGEYCQNCGAIRPSEAST